MKILAAIVTYNRLKLLKRCIKYINKQTRKVDDLIVINNSSSDGTVDFLIKNKIKHITQINSGSAGGWNAAISYALDKNFDKVWLMDDDGYPNYNSLEFLHEKYDDQYSCISSIVIDEKNHSNLIFPMPILNNKKLPVLFSARRKKYTIDDFSEEEIYLNKYNFCHLFNGALLSLNHIKLIGNINSNFFMYGDEVDYFFRLRTVGKVVTILNSIHFHPNVSKRPLSTKKLYYYIKNSIILNYKYFDYSFIRSVFNIIIALIRYFGRNKFKDNLKFIFFFRIKYVFIAILRGFRFKIDVDYKK